MPHAFLNVILTKKLEKNIYLDFSSSNSDWRRRFLKNSVGMSVEKADGFSYCGIYWDFHRTISDKEIIIHYVSKLGCVSGWFRKQQFFLTLAQKKTRYQQFKKEKQQHFYMINESSPNKGPLYFESDKMLHSRSMNKLLLCMSHPYKNACAHQHGRLYQ